MASEKLRGLAEATAMMDRLPGDAEEQLGVELAIIGREILADQRALTPKDTGELAAGLSLRLFLDNLKLRVGLLGQRNKKGRNRSGRLGKRTSNLLDLYYGRFVALGRSAQTVLVTRKVSRRRKAGKNDVGKPYRLRVKAKEARDFIRVPGAVDTATGQLAQFWSRLLARREGGA